MVYIFLCIELISSRLIYTFFFRIALSFPLRRRLAASFSIAPNLCCIDSSPADFFPSFDCSERAVWKRRFYTWVSTSINSNIISPSPSPFAPSLLPSVFPSFLVNSYCWCDVNVMKFFPFGFSCLTQQVFFFFFVTLKLSGSPQSRMLALAPSVSISYSVNPAFVPRFHQFKALWVLIYFYGEQLRRLNADFTAQIKQPKCSRILVSTVSLLGIITHFSVFLFQISFLVCEIKNRPGWNKLKLYY